LRSFTISERSQNLCNQIHRASGKGVGFSGAGQSLAKEGLHNATRRALSQKAYRREWIDGSPARPTFEFDAAPRGQAAALPAGDHVGVRSLVLGLLAELAQLGRNDGRARRDGRPRNRSSLGI
jgi:hypothetical protein